MYAHVCVCARVVYAFVCTCTVHPGGKTREYYIYVYISFFIIIITISRGYRKSLIYFTFKIFLPLYKERRIEIIKTSHSFIVTTDFCRPGGYNFYNGIGPFNVSTTYKKHLTMRLLIDGHVN